MPPDDTWDSVSAYTGGDTVSYQGAGTGPNGGPRKTPGSSDVREDLCILESEALLPRGELCSF